jgi:biotin carboxyl carrier protein
MVDILVNGETFSIQKKLRDDDTVELAVNGKPVIVERVSSFGTDSSTQLLRIGPRLLLCRVAGHLNEHTIITSINDKRFSVDFSTGQETTARTGTFVVHTGPISVETPMAGRIVEVTASVGKEVQEGQSLVILEAMKMENEIAAPRNGRVREIYVRVGSVVKTGDKLLVLD